MITLNGGWPILISQPIPTTSRPWSIVGLALPVVILIGIAPVDWLLNPTRTGKVQWSIYWNRLIPPWKDLNRLANSSLAGLGLAERPASSLITATLESASIESLASLTALE